MQNATNPYENKHDMQVMHRKQEEFSLSSKPQKAMQEMMDTIDQLREVYERETDALLRSDAKEFMAMQEEKLDVARKYQSGIGQMLERKDEMKSVDPDMRTKLENMQQEFSGLAQENMQALERMRRCMDTLGTTLRKAATDAAKKDRTFAYTANGMTNVDESKTISTGSFSETA